MKRRKFLERVGAIFGGAAAVAVGGTPEGEKGVCNEVVYESEYGTLRFNTTRTYTLIRDEGGELREIISDRPEIV